MGVKSLWNLLTPVGRPVMLETMEGKTVAIDSSIWIYQFQATMRAKDGRTLVNAHVLGFLRRICKLLFYGMKPVFVFDGGAPALKRSTLNERRKKKSGAAASHAKLAEKLLAAQMRREALKHVKGSQSSKGKGKVPTGPVELNDDTVYLEDLDPNAPKSPAKKRKIPESKPSPKKKFYDHDPYKLPDVNINEQVEKATRSAVPDPRLATEEELRAFIEDMRPEDFDVTSPAFRELPTEVQYEIVGDLRLKSRQTSHTRLQQMLRAAPTPLDFSKQQIKQLQQRNTLTQQLLTTTDSIGKAHISIPVRIASERNKEYVLIKNEGSEGGWILGIKDTGGTKEKPIVIDHESDREAEENSEDDDMDMEEVDIPAQSTDVDPDLRNYRRKMALSSIAMRYTPKKLAPMTTKPTPHTRGVPLFDMEEDVGHPTAANDLWEEDEEVALALQQSFDQPTTTLSADPDSENEGLAFAIQQSLDQKQTTSSTSRPTLDIERRSRLNAMFASHEEPVASSSKINEQPTASSGISESSFSFGKPFLLLSSSSRSQTTSPVKQPRPSVPEPPVASPIPTSGKKTVVDQRLDFTLAPSPKLCVDDAVPSRPVVPASLASSFGPRDSTVEWQKVPSVAKQLTVIEDAQAPVGTTSPPDSDNDMEEIIPIVQSTTVDHDTVPSMVLDRQFPLSTSHSNAGATAITTHTRNNETPTVTEQNSVDDVEPPVGQLDLATASLPDPDDDIEGIASIERSVPDHDAVPSIALGDQSSNSTSHSSDRNQLITVPTRNTLTIQTTERKVTIIPPPSALGNESPISHSRSPSPDEFSHRDGSPRPSSPAEESWDAAQEIDPVAEEGEFARFMSQVKGRDINDVRREIDDEIRVLDQQRKNALRDSEDVSQQMITQIMMMLRLFGIPYITAPMEAEAQCAKLVSLGLVDGIITDDSDVFLFGGQRVFKNMFNQSKTVECFLLSDLGRELGLDQGTLIRLAYLLGSDYVEGLPGVGPVVAMELLKEFPGDDGLHKFRHWWQKVQTGRDKEDDNTSAFRRRFKKKFKDLYLPPEWPNAAVRDAYYHPTVDESEEPFKWGLPDLDALREFLHDELGWQQNKVDDLLLPIISKMGKRTKASALNKQGNLNDFLDVSSGSGTYAPKKRQAYASKRLQQVVSDFRKKRKNASGQPGTDDIEEDEDDRDTETEDPPNRSEGQAPPKKRARKSVIQSAKGKGKGKATERGGTSVTGAAKGKGRGRTGAGKSKGKGKGRGRGKMRDISEEDEDEDVEISEDDFEPEGGLATATDAANDPPLPPVVNLRPRPKPRPAYKGAVRDTVE